MNETNMIFFKYTRHITVFGYMPILGCLRQLHQERTTEAVQCCLTSDIFWDQVYPTLHGPFINYNEYKFILIMWCTGALSIGRL